MISPAFVLQKLGANYRGCLLENINTSQLLRLVSLSLMEACVMPLLSQGQIIQDTLSLTATTDKATMSNDLRSEGDHGARRA